MKKPDPGLDHIWEIRREISAEHGHDPKRLCDYYRTLEEKHKGRVITTKGPLRNPPS